MHFVIYSTIVTASSAATQSTTVEMFLRLDLLLTIHISLVWTQCKVGLTSIVQEKTSEHPFTLSTKVMIICHQAFARLDFLFTSREKISSSPPG